MARQKKIITIAALIGTVSLLMAACLPAETPTPESVAYESQGGKELATVDLSPTPPQTATPADVPLTPTNLNRLDYPTLVPTETPIPTPSPTFPYALIPTREGGPLSVGGCTVPEPYARAWEVSEVIQTSLGCPSGLPGEVSGAMQDFEHGFMFWRAIDRKVLIISTRGIENGEDTDLWWILPDTWEDGQMSEDPGINPPEGFFEPVRGFGKIWRENAAIKDSLGWATLEEASWNLKWLDFEGGWIVSNPYGNQYYALIRLAPGDTEGLHYGGS